MNVPAKHWEKTDGDNVRCGLCPHRCAIPEGGAGMCLIRKNINGKLIQTAYGESCSISIDPIEKKPLYHFHPASPILSVGTNGCNMRCRNCQNWQISTQETIRRSASPEELLAYAEEMKSFAIAYTYNEPVVWYEFVYDCAKVFKDAGLKNVMVTNGQINKEPLTELIPMLDAMNIDLKGFTDEFYAHEGGYIQTTLDTIKRCYEAGIHIELTNLLIPGLNDEPETFEEMCEWISQLSTDIPLHISRYFPQHKSNHPVTTDNTLTEFRNIAKNHLSYVYIGNASIADSSDTRCPKCGEMIIQRSGYKTICNLEENKCPKCSNHLPISL